MSGSPLNLGVRLILLVIQINKCHKGVPRRAKARYSTQVNKGGNTMAYAVDREKALELKEIIEDSVEYFCDENMISGELSWIMVHTLAEAKLAELLDVK